jgi:hypothetical protein
MASRCSLKTETTNDMTKFRPSRLCSSLLISTLTAALSLGLFAGCSSVSTKIDRAPVAARTFSFLNTGSKPLPSYAEPRQEVHAAIQQAIVKNLATKGVAWTTNGGDVTVAYLIIVGNNVETTSLNSYFGYNSDADALVDKVHKEQAVASTDRNYFEAGTLVIDFLDPKSSKILQRRTIQAPVLRNLSAADRTTRVQAIVDQALNDIVIAR